MQSSFDSMLEESQRAATNQYPVPALGQTRCYWSLLDAGLRYLYLDPTFSVHLGEEAGAIVGTCLLDFVHPNERDCAQENIGQVLASRSLHGSFIRLRCAHLAKIWAILGCNSPAPFPDAHILTADERYIACDVVINWVSNNLVLCFFHAAVDKCEADNDELHKTHWTNWCGTSAMTTWHAAGLLDQLRQLVPPSSARSNRIFQIHINQPTRPVLFSWPPEGDVAGEFGKLVHRMQIGGSDGDDHQGSHNGAKTSCTRRYRNKHRFLDGEVWKKVESIFIPHGAVIFACHKVVAPRSHPGVQCADTYNKHLHQSNDLAQPHQLPQAEHYSGADDFVSGVPGSPEYAHSRVTRSGSRRGPAEYGVSQHGVHKANYVHWSAHVQQPYHNSHPIPPIQQRNQVHASARPYSYPGPRNAEDLECPRQLQPAWSPSIPQTMSLESVDYGGGQSGMVPQGGPRGPVKQVHTYQRQLQQSDRYSSLQPSTPTNPHATSYVPPHIHSSVGDGTTALGSSQRESDDNVDESSVASQITVTHEMSIAEILGHLGCHGCNEVTSHLDVSRCSEYPISSGGFGDVYRGAFHDGKQVAVKCLRLYMDSTDIAKKQLKRAPHELYVWSKCDHPNVLKLIGTARYRDQLAMVSPWAEYSSLQKLTSQHPQVDRYKLCYQLTDGVAYLHNIGLVHGDIKGANILFSHDFTPKLTDFGSAALREYTLQFTNTTSQAALSLRWAAPEMLGGEIQPSTQSDVYSLGMTILEIVTGSVPYAGMRDPAVITRILTKVHPSRPEAHISSQNMHADLLWSLLTSCWAYNPGDRPSAVQAQDKMREIALKKRQARSQDKLLNETVKRRRF